MGVRTLCVFCGSSKGVKAAYAEAARATGLAIGERGWRLVYGGASVGLMGILADVALEAGAEVIGVMPRSMVDREIAHSGLAELRIVETMHQRKAEMAELSDAFLALPGGLGTLEELLETWTWAQLGLHDKAFGVVNVTGYFDPLVNMVHRMVEEGFMRANQIDRLVSDPSPDTVMSWLDRHTGS
ncbi:MAG: TIGR00730 family Rossman fold protein [Gemmatimonadales bacterium]